MGTRDGGTSLGGIWAGILPCGGALSGFCCSVDFWELCPDLLQSHHSSECHQSISWGPQHLYLIYSRFLLSLQPPGFFSALIPSCPPGAALPARGFGDFLMGIIRVPFFPRLTSHKPFNSPAVNPPLYSASSSVIPWPCTLFRLPGRCNLLLPTRVIPVGGNV